MKQPRHVSVIDNAGSKAHRLTFKLESALVNPPCQQRVLADVKHVTGRELRVGGELQQGTIDLSIKRGNENCVLRAARPVMVTFPSSEAMKIVFCGPRQMLSFTARYKKCLPSGRNWGQR